MKMQNITVRFIGKENASDINIKNEKFKLFGRMIPSYQDGNWSYTVEENDEIEWDIFPDENYDFDAMKEEYVFIGAYDGEECIGLAIFQKQWFKYFYLYDLKVNSKYRGQHIGEKLLEKAGEYAKEAGYRGLWTIGQDNNLGACLFYVNNGFEIGGLDTSVYKGTKQEGKADIHFYKDF